MKISLRFLTATILLAGCAPAQHGFHLKDGDRVVFYGDSITNQRLYTTFVETYVVTRYPKLDVSFVHSGWGGDRVTGGAGGGIDDRLSRDVISFKPNVVTIMLGMNDGRVRAYDEQIFRIYANGYKKMVKDLKTALPGVRITAIEPSPYDDVTRKPGFPGGYNAVLLRFSDFVRELSKSEGLTVADLNKPVVAMLGRAYKTDAAGSLKIVPDRVHPGPAGHLVMAEQLLKAWKASAVVSAVEINAQARRVAKSQNTKISDTGFNGPISWTQTDNSLPVALDMADPVMALAVNSSDFLASLNQQIVKVTGLPAGNHTLRIDGEEAGTYPADDWAKGVNIATLKTPIWEQAARVHALTIKHNNVHFSRWRDLQLPLDSQHPETLQPALAALDTLEAELVRQQRAAAQPKPHQFELIAGDSEFKPQLPGGELTGWHISKESRHGDTKGWASESGVLTATQDKPGNGGIVLTDRKYRNFEVSLELKPDYSCDSGLFLRSNEKGEAYQVMLDYLDGGAIGGVYGEGLQGVTTTWPNWREVWKNGEWNHLRARIEGDSPHIQVWLNGIKITDFQDTANHAAGGATSGMIALQVHRGDRWIPGGKHRFRNVAVRELP